MARVIADNDHDYALFGGGLTPIVVAWPDGKLAKLASMAKGCSDRSPSLLKFIGLALPTPYFSTLTTRADAAIEPTTMKAKEVQL